ALTKQRRVRLVRFEALAPRDLGLTQLERRCLVARDANDPRHCTRRTGVGLARAGVGDGLELRLRNDRATLAFDGLRSLLGASGGARRAAIVLALAAQKDQWD